VSEIRKFGVPVCDYQLYANADPPLRERLDRCINRMMVLNEYENKKDTPFTHLLENVRKQMAIEMKADLRVKKQKKFKRQLGKLISNYIKARMPNSAENTVYTMEVFKFITHKMDNFVDHLHGQATPITNLDSKFRFLKQVMVEVKLISEVDSPLKIKSELQDPNRYDQEINKRME